MPPLLLEARLLVRHLIAIAIAQVSIQTHLLLVLRVVQIGRHLFLLTRDTEDAVGLFFEMGITQNLPQPEVAIESKQAVTAGLMLRTHAGALREGIITPMRSDMADSPPCLSSSSSFSTCLRS
jgi:hypothetical protein